MSVLCMNNVAYGPFVASGTPVSPYTFRHTYDLRPATAPDWITAMASGSSYYGQMGATSNSAVELGAACPTVAMVAMSRADYDTLRSHMSGVTTEDVALLTTAVMLTWAVAWLVKRAVRVLIPNG